MAIDRNKIIAEAQKYIQKGQLKKAIREYYRILEEEPDDVRLLLSDAFRGTPASMLMLPKLLPERPEWADCIDAELPPLRPM